MKHTAIWGGVVFLFVFDRLLKLAALSFGNDQGLFIRSLNANLAFSIRAPQWIYQFVIPLLVLLFFCLGAFNLWRKKNEAIGYFLLGQGALSNLLDRFFYNGVVDYINLWIWPVFNLADILILLGLVILLKREISKIK